MNSHIQSFSRKTKSLLEKTKKNHKTIEESEEHERDEGNESWFSLIRLMNRIYITSNKLPLCLKLSQLITTKYGLKSPVKWAS